LEPTVSYAHVSVPEYYASSSAPVSYASESAMSSVVEAVPEVVYPAPDESAVSSVVSAAPEFTQHIL